jgi:hypothetical protein
MWISAAFQNVRRACHTGGSSVQEKIQQNLLSVARELLVPVQQWELLYTAVGSI